MRRNIGGSGQNMTQLTPLAFGDVFGRVSMQIPHNRTVLALQNSFDQLKVTRALNEMGQYRFINLVEGATEQGDIAVTLYAGDGIVTKVTDAAYAGRSQHLPLVVPAFQTKLVEMELGSGFLIESFPYLSRRATEEDVRLVGRELTARGARFAREDDRPNNLRLAADGNPAIVDAGAVEILPETSTASLATATKAWHAQFKRNYPVIYNPDYVFRQSDVTNFRLIDPPSTVYPLKTAAAEKPAAKRYWFGFFNPA